MTTISRVSVKDANSTPQYFRTANVGTEILSLFVPSDFDGNAYSNTNPLNVKVATGNLVLSTGTSVIGRVGLQVGGIDLSNSNPVPIITSGNVSITGSVVSTLTPSSLTIGKVGLQVAGADVTNLNPVPATITNSISISNFPASTAISGNVVVGTGTNVIGKIGLQVAGADVSNTNAIPTRPVANVVVSVNNFPVVQTVGINAGSNVIGKVGLQVSGSDVSSVAPLPVSVTGTQSVTVSNFPATTTLGAGNSVIGNVNLQTPDGIQISASNPLPVLFSGNIVINSASTSTTLNPGNNYVGKVGVQLGGFDISNVNPFPVTITTGATVSVSNFPTSTAISGNVVVSVNNFPTSTTLGAGANVIGKVGLQVAGVDVTNTNPVFVSATALPLPTGAATATNQASEIAALGSTADVAWTGTGSSSIIAAMKAMSVKYINGVLGKVGIQIGGTDVSNTNPVPMNVMNTIGISNFPATQPISGSVSVSNLPATQTVNGAISVTNFPSTTTIAAGSNLIGKVSIQSGGTDNANSNPLFVNDYQNMPIQGVIAISAVDTTVTAGRLFVVNCTVAGNVNVRFSDGSTYTLPVDVGLNMFPFAVTQVVGTGTTATATYCNLK